ncbi:hypothetical protein [Stenotrophomonas sp. C1657]|uniref:hypothetical protein n=1 Tax=Stenotrophomonas sp. C1657 TaxID=3077844 RepID=UPI00293C9606|nr:hypothetical protein [Stenotrophomonas sp. C1657]MDV3515177.1 hypothetical protein [Stenotrophomonas sp. C1657]
MAAPFWQAGNLYLPGDLVQPITQPAPNNPQVANGYFESGATGWTFSGDAALSNTGGYGSAKCVVLPGNKPDGVALNNTQLVVPVGGQLTANSMIQQGASVAGATAGWTEIRWYDSLNTLLQTDKGNVVDSGSNGAWHQSTVTATAPASAAYARAAIHLTSVADHNHEIFGDNLVVSGASAGLPKGLVYKAVQTDSGLSGSSEPAWPGILGQQVVDNEVIWEAVTTSRVTWTASPRYVSGATEPVWPTDVGGMVQDGTINWKAIARRVEDEKCPNSKVVAIVASKVFAADKDIVKFSATANPLDWSTADDAGYLPTGLQQANANDMAVLQQYRSNLVALNASSFQNWQVDPDPASMAILDQMDGIGSVWPRAAVAVSNDLFYLAALGVRTVGIANAAENLAAGDVGAPIDGLVQEAIRVASANGSKVVGTYYPGAGQYWLAISEYPADGLSIAGSLPDGLVGNSGTYQYLVRGGILPRVVTISSGTLPPGANISPSGLVTYAYTTKGNYAWTVRVTDNDGSYFDLPDSSSVGQENVWNSMLVTSSYALSNSTKTVTQISGGIGSGNQISVSGRSAGKWYFEVQGAGQFETTPTGIYGVGPAGFSPNGGSLGSAVGHGAGMGSHGFAFKDNVTSARIAAPYPGNRRCMVAFDADTGRLWFGVAGVWVNGGNPATGANPFYTMPAGTYFPMVSLGQISSAYTLLTKPADAQYQPPAGFALWLQQ